MNQVNYSIYIHQDNEVLDMGKFTNCTVPRVGEHLTLSIMDSDESTLTDLKYQVFKVEHVQTKVNPLSSWRLENDANIIVHVKCAMSHKTFHSFEKLSKHADQRFNLGNLFDQLD